MLPAYPASVITETPENDPDFTDLFDGIFDDELEAESAPDDWALEVLLGKHQSERETEQDADQSHDVDHATEPSMVTAGDDEEADDSTRITGSDLTPFNYSPTGANLCPAGVMVCP